MANYELPPELQNLNSNRYALIIQMITNIERDFRVSKTLGEDKTYDEIIQSILCHKKRQDNEPHW